MTCKIAILFGSYRSDSNGVRVVKYLESELQKNGHEAIVCSAKEYDLPMLDRMYKEHDLAPENMETLAEIIRTSDAFLVVSGEYNHSMQAGLQNMMDHYLDEWAWRPAGIVGYSVGSYGGVRGAMHLRAYLGELGLVTIPSILAIGPVTQKLDENGILQDDSFAKRTARFLKELDWYKHALQHGRKEGTPHGLFSNERERSGL
jgi:NAD(P)H-dependent FMN reductase